MKADYRLASTLVAGTAIGVLAVTAPRTQAKSPVYVIVANQLIRINSRID
jgi:hypothetical protein